MRFRPCIDLHSGKVKQIVGETLDANPQRVVENFVSEHDSAYYASMFKRDSLTGGHVIMLGGGNEEAALAALRDYPGGLQIGGGCFVKISLLLNQDGVVARFLYGQLRRRDVTRVFAVEENRSTDGIAGN